MLIIFWNALISVIGFWALLTVRIITLYRLGIKSLNLSTKGGINNLFASIAFFGVIFLWSLIFVINSIVEIEFFLFIKFWNNGEFLWFTIIGIILAYFFQIEMWIGIITMGRSYRVGVDEKHLDKLITRGLFKYSRNPIYLGMDGLVLSAFIVQPNLFFLSFAIMSIILFHLQILREEKNLANHFGDQYQEYCNNTKRYFLFF